MKKARWNPRKRLHGKKSFLPQKRLTAIILTLIFIFTLTTACYSSSFHLGLVANSAAILSAKLTMPQGGADVISEQLDSVAGLFNQPVAAANISTVTQVRSTAPSSASTPSGEETSSAGSVATVSSSPSSSAVSGLQKLVRTLQLGPTSSSVYESYGDIFVYNETASHKADIKNQLAITPDVKISLKSPPQVLIVHTHTTESYASTDTGYYDPNAPTRNTDKTESVVRVGDEIAKALEASGIGVYHDTTYNDYPDYNGAYDRSLTVIQNDLKKYPSIKVILDIHRDAIEYSDGSRAKPTVVINGKKCAQLMVVSCCNEPGTALSVPDWQWNYRFGLRIQQQLVKSHPGLARPLDLCPRRYNMQASHGSLLVEFGTDVNTLDEAVYAGQLFGQELAKVLLGLQS